MEQEYDEFVLRIDIHGDGEREDFIIQCYWSEEFSEMRYIVLFQGTEVGVLHLVDIHQWEWIHCCLVPRAARLLGSEISRRIEMRDS